MHVTALVKLCKEVELQNAYNKTTSRRSLSQYQVSTNATYSMRQIKEPFL